MVHRDYAEKTTIHPAAQTQGFKYSATLIPKGPGGKRGGVWIPDALQLSSSSKNPDEAWLALKWFADHDTGLALALQKSTGVSTTPGARPDVYNDPKFLNHDLYPRVLQELDRDFERPARELPGQHPGQLQDPGGRRHPHPGDDGGLQERGRADAVVPEDPQRRAPGGAQSPPLAGPAGLAPARRDPAGRGATVSRT